jgi:hypothetical protein
MVMGRMIYYFSPSKAVFSIPAGTIATLFVTLDIVSFVVQLVGGSMAGPTAPPEEKLKAVHIYMGGIGLQQFFILIFVALVVKFQIDMARAQQSNRIFAVPRTNWRFLLWTVYASLGLITVGV